LAVYELPRHPGGLKRKGDLDLEHFYCAVICVPDYRIGGFSLTLVSVISRWLFD